MLRPQRFDCGGLGSIAPWGMAKKKKKKPPKMYYQFSPFCPVTSTGDSFFFFLIGGLLPYNVVLDSAVQQCKSAIIIHISPQS